MATRSSKTKGKAVKQTKAQAATTKVRTKGGTFQSNPDSVPSQLAALEVGESYSRGKRIPVDEFMAEEMRDWFDRVINQLGVQVTRTRERNPKLKFSTEKVNGFSYSAEHMLCAIIVTRTA